MPDESGRPLAVRGESPAWHRDWVMRPSDKARRGRIPAVCGRGVTPAGGMQRRSNAAGLSPRAASSRPRPRLYPWRCRVLAPFAVDQAACLRADGEQRVDSSASSDSVGWTVTDTCTTATKIGVGARMRAGLRASNRRARHLPMRYETGLPSSVIRFRTLHASTASRRCPDELRARRQSPTIDLYRKNALVHNSRSRSIIALHPEIRGPA